MHCYVAVWESLPKQSWREINMDGFQWNRTFKGMVHPKMNTAVVYSISCRFKPVQLSFFVQNTKVICNQYNESEWELWLSSSKMAPQKWFVWCVHYKIGSFDSITILSLLKSYNSLSWGIFYEWVFEFTKHERMIPLWIGLKTHWFGLRGYSKFNTEKHLQLWLCITQNYHTSEGHFYSAFLFFF